MRAILLDLDGTLSDNFVGISRCIRHALDALASPCPVDDDLRVCVGPPLRQSFARLLRCDEDARVEQAIALYRERYGALGWHENVVYDGIPDMLAALGDAGCRLYVCTSKPEVYASRIAQRFGLTRHLAGLYGATLDGALDDKRHLVARVIETEGLAPETCLMVGDREHDVLAAHANGVHAIGVLWGYGSREELERAGADALAATPVEVVDLVLGK